MSVILVTDSSCDMPLSFLKENNIEFLSLTFNIDGKDYPDDLGAAVSHPEFYQMVREGKMPVTSQVNSYEFVERFQKWLDEGHEIIYLAFSSALSGTCQSAVIARQEIAEKRPDAKIFIVDSKAASGGEGLLVWYALRQRNNGKSAGEIAAFLEEKKKTLCHFFTVDDLNHLKRGGRISSASAIVGGILNIKPVMYVDDEGRLIPWEKVRGRKKAVRFMFEKFCQFVKDPGPEQIVITHGDCLEDANDLKGMILQKHPQKDVLISYVGAAVGAHSGPGTLALFFVGSQKDPTK